MSKQPEEYIRHIYLEINYLTAQVDNLDIVKFLKNETQMRAFARSLEIIDEASKQVDQEFRKLHPEIEWKEMSGMRDRLIHHYFGVDYEIVWDVVKNEIPKLKLQIESLLKI